MSTFTMLVFLTLARRRRIHRWSADPAADPPGHALLGKNGDLRPNHALVDPVPPTQTRRAASS